MKGGFLMFIRLHYDYDIAKRHIIPGMAPDLKNI